VSIGCFAFSQNCFESCLASRITRDRPGIVVGDDFLRCLLGDDLNIGKGLCIRLIYQVRDWFARPFADLLNIRACGRGQEAGVHDENIFVADDDRSVALRECVGSVRVADFINVVRQLGDGAFFGRG
jgi:hypothetical protein